MKRKMLSRDQKYYLIKQVDCFALSEKRVEAMKGYKAVFGIPECDVKELADFVMLREETIRDIARSSEQSPIIEA
jgi:hypothetical protein